MLNNISDAGIVQPDLFMQLPERKGDLMKVLDQINDKFGKGTLRSGQEGFSKLWVMRSNKKSPAYTTNWNQIISVA